MFLPIPPVVSHAQRGLITLIQQRKFTNTMTKVLKESGITHTQAFIPQLHKMVVGQSRPQYSLIYILRETIPPVNWYYDENEILPNKKEFVARHAKYERIEFSQFATTAHNFFSVIIDNRLLQHFCTENHLKRQYLANYIYQRTHKSGELRYSTRPSYQFIRKLREIIHPDFWYIFPDEIADKGEIKKLAYEYVSRVLK